MFTEEDMSALYQFIMWDDEKFINLTEGPRHRQLILSILSDKKSNVLIREALIARKLGLVHNTKMHSTTNGVTSFDATHPITARCYEIKAEQYTTNNQDRKTQSGQITGTGVFSTIDDEASFIKLRDASPMIAHGMFYDGRMLGLVTFELIDCPAIDRIEKYFRGSTKTAPRYSYQDWINSPSLKIEYISDKWPDNISRKYKKELIAKLLMQQILENNSSLELDSVQPTKIDPTQQTSIPYTEVIDQQQNLDFEEIQPIVLSEIS